MASLLQSSRVEQPSETSKPVTGKKQKTVRVVKENQQTMLASKDIDTNWDIDYYKTDHESDEHWALRRKFMATHKDKFPEDRLVCLAKAFVNIEFMRCQYPAEIMSVVAELSQEVAKDFRAERARKLQRTFVKASDAAEQKAKRRKLN